MDKITFKSGIYAVTVQKKEGKENYYETILFKEFDDLVKFYIGLTDIEQIISKPQRVSAGIGGLSIADVMDGKIWERAYRLSKDKKES